jgi:hypothetical protein
VRCPAPRRPRDPQAMRELKAAVKRWRQGLARWEAEGERLRAERLEAMKRADEAGIPRSEIADQFTLSHQRVSTMLKRGG